MNGRRAYALFDAGATHSFVSKLFVSSAGWKVEESENELTVMLPNGLRRPQQEYIEIAKC